MSELTAAKALEALDRDKRQVELTVRQVMHLLHDFIPPACHREAEKRLFDTFFINGVELTTNTMRKEYEHWKSIQIEASMLWPVSKVQP